MPCKVKDVDTEIFSAWHSITINVSRETLKEPFRVQGCLEDRGLRLEVRG
jgi:hypothetical protein